MRLLFYHLDVESVYITPTLTQNACKEQTKQPRRTLLSDGDLPRHGHIGVIYI